MAVDWKEYQQEAAEFFRSLGLSADIDMTLKGARTTHDVDVVVRSKHVGFEILWLVECKHWKSPVSKLHVLGLREIVADLGADRGILLCEAGFQAGAIEAANLTNVQVSSLATLSLETKNDLSAMRLRDIADRVAIAKSLYWDLDKSYRIKIGLRSDSFEHSYSGNLIVLYSETVLAEARRERYPIQMGEYGSFLGFDLPKTYHSFDEITTALDPMLTDLEERLAKAYAALK
ncbi:restriction endonuclease [Sphingomonas colocasiae]|uniref:Restriction endonuclease n=1 Tax=Sphingomonas colocasiae TaxID=1848973 RepID=A0ABS7PQY7_9SPHN|nr:restriction endonuclease [Sphingomonas colocasiae]MBY8823748.1 restriction endonuclease [Sphingomonas colocasiae]